MNEFILPQGDRAALMPGAAYSVPGLFLYSDLIYQCLDQVKEKFGYAIPVRYLYGAPKVRWKVWPSDYYGPPLYPGGDISGTGRGGGTGNCPIADLLLPRDCPGGFGGFCLQ